MIEANEKLLTAVEAAEELSISPQQLRLLIRQERIPAEKHGRDWIIKSSDLQLVKERPKGRPAGAKDSKPRKAGTPKKTEDESKTPPKPPAHPPFPTKNKSSVSATPAADEVKTKAETDKRADKRVKK